LFSIVAKVPKDGVGSKMNPIYPKYSKDIGIVSFITRGQTEDSMLVELFSEQVAILEVLCLEVDVEVFERKY
jgi:hypothetical protein